MELSFLSGTFAIIDISSWNLQTSHRNWIIQHSPRDSSLLLYHRHRSLLSPLPPPPPLPQWGQFHSVEQRHHLEQLNQVSTYRGSIHTGRTVVIVARATLTDSVTPLDI